MLFSKLSSYQTSQGAGTQAPTQIKVAQSKMVSTLGEMKPGQIFEGRVNEAKNGQVKIALSNGQTITASIGGKVNLPMGDTMFFQVKSTSDNAIYIKPYTSIQGENVNPILYRALEAANLAISQNNLQLVDAMMQEGMGIDKESLSRMAQSISGYDNFDITSLVQMQKLGLTISQDNYNQFVNYKNNEQAFLTDLNQLTKSLQTVYASRDNAPSMVLQLNTQIVEGLEVTSMSQIQAQNLQSQIQEAELILVGNNWPQESTEPRVELSIQETALPQVNTSGIEENLSQLANPEAEMVMEEEMQVGQRVIYQPSSAGALLGQEGIINFSRQLMQIPQLAADGNLFQGNVLNPNLTKEEVVLEIAKVLSGTSLGLEEETLAQNLLAGKEYQTLLQGVLEEQWTLSPELVSEKQQIDQLYERIHQQMNLISKAVKDFGGDSAKEVLNSAGKVTSNLEFINQVNQLYNYVQIPLRMMQENVHSDLYVYTNKRNLASKEGDLSCLLHLDMKHLGPTDVYVKMKGSSVSTDFSLSDDKSYELIMNNIHILQSRLNELGYSCQVQVNNLVEKKDFVKDFLEQEERVGTIKRYSFDMKA